MKRIIGTFGSVLILLIVAWFVFGASAAWAGPMEDAKAADVRGDYADELRITKPLAATGEVWAQYNLGVMYMQGQGVPQDYLEAAKWYRLAAVQRYAPAQYALGRMYVNGQGVPQDNAEAAKWYRLAAAEGHASAQAGLGLMYSLGLGVPQDYVRAHMWLNLSAVSGNSYALKGRETIAKKMTTQQIAEAQKMARECQASKLKVCD